MKKLELKHLAPYLPYDLKYKFNNVTYIFRNTIDFDYEYSKPILRPLSDLTKDFIDTNKLLDSMPLKQYFGFNIEIDNLGIVGFRTPESWLPLANWIPLYQKLFELHIDVFGLIEKDLAIDINTI